MTSDGHRRPPRPRIEVVKGIASDEESAAIATALERFLAETAPAPGPAQGSRWQQTALREGVARDPGRDPWRAPR